VGKRITYDSLADGEWTSVPRGGEKIACCDCGLVHLVKVSRLRGRVGLRHWRLGPETGGVRKAMISKALRR
jgi:hypothetical protein